MIHEVVFHMILVSSLYLRECVCYNTQQPLKDNKIVFNTFQFIFKKVKKHLKTLNNLT